MKQLTPKETWEFFVSRAKRVGWTIAELCRRADVHRSTVSQWRIDAASPNTKTVARLEAALEPIEKALNVYTAGGEAE
jgi:transcriptional regulator with XRE-family HTH domain